MQSRAFLKLTFLTILIGVVIIAVGRPIPVEAGRSWVTSNNNVWNVDRTCRNGASITVVHDQSITPDAELEIPVIEVGITPQWMTHPPGDLIDADGEIIDAFIDPIFFPMVGSRQLFSESIIQSEPLEVNLSGDPSPLQTYYLYTSGDIRFYAEMPVGAWVIYEGSMVDQVADCYLPELSSVGESEIDFATDNYFHVPGDALVYTLETVPASGQLRLGLDLLEEN
ncbi:MAG: hypothetical protein AAF633_10350, partial [Chloroflexota bacterium]